MAEFKPKVWMRCPLCKEQSPMPDPDVREWVYLTDEHIKEIVGPYSVDKAVNTYALPIIGYTRKLFDQIEAKSKELNT